ncbi:MAG: DegQ family serine endoprotease [Chitinivorax sp.]
MKKLFVSAALLVASIGVSQAARELPDFAALVEKEGPAVVNISTTQTVVNNGGVPGLAEDDPFNELLRRFNPRQYQPREYQARSLGSGFIISSDGYILTNTHVVGNADEITVKLTDQREYKAKVIGTDERTDVALIKIEAKNLPTVRTGDSEKIRVGEWVVAIGSPLGLENSVTAGIVSAKGRSLPSENYVPFIQTDAAVNPGNSGGPLFNLNGEVVGINSQIISRTGGFMGISLAIPIKVALDVSDQLKTNGRVIRGRIGVNIQELSKDLAESFGLTRPQGALISSVEKDGPADKAGLLPSDIVLKFDTHPVANSAELVRLVGGSRPGTKVSLQVWRNKAAKDVAVTVGETSEQVANARPGRGKAGGHVGNVGLVVAELNPAQKKALGIDYGLLVQAVHGSAARSGIAQGDVIIGVNSQNLTSYAQFAKMLEEAKAGSSLNLRVRRGDNYIFIPLKIGKSNADE